MPGSYIGCVYLATSTANGTIYIGKSKLGLAFRRRTHEKSREPVGFPAAIRKYGKEAFDWRVIYVSDDDGALMAAEVELIADYRATGIRMYNITNGGDGCAGRKMSDAQIARLRGPRSDEFKAAVRAGIGIEGRLIKAERMRNRVVTEESRKKQSESRKGMKFSAEHCANMAKARRGIKMEPWTPERRAKMEAAWERRRALGINKLSDETRQRQSDAAKRRCERGRSHLSEAGKKGAAARWRKPLP